MPMLRLPGNSATVYYKDGKAVSVGTIHKILAPADLSNHCKVGVQYALEMAQSQGAEVLIYNVLTVEETPYPQAEEAWIVEQTELPKLKRALEQRKSLLNEFVSQSFGDLLATTSVRQEIGIGTPYKKIIEKAERGGFDMVVMSTHGRTGLLHMLIGSVTERVVRRAPCPVLAVPPPGKPKAMATPNHSHDRTSRSARLKRR
jgi:nucleotide-binding universal stress UspA family protein